MTNTFLSFYQVSCFGTPQTYPSAPTLRPASIPVRTWPPCPARSHQVLVLWIGGHPATSHSCPNSTQEERRWVHSDWTTTTPPSCDRPVAHDQQWWPSETHSVTHQWAAVWPWCRRMTLRPTNHQASPLPTHPVAVGHCRDQNADNNAASADIV